MTGGKPENSADNPLSAVANREEETLKFWLENGIFEKSLKLREGAPEFVFYDGPPFATGLPHTGSLLSSVAKDVIPRYKTMRGFYVRRRWGWDCHGLPIENMIEKELGLKSKKDIEAMGIDKFNEACRSAVLRYADDWRKYVNRVARWVDFDHAYMTMNASYTESVWWALKELQKKGLLYEGRKVLMYCPHCETPVSKAETAMDNSYKDVTEEAVTVKLKVKNPSTYNLVPSTYLLAWTTTPWTLPANVALAVGPEIEYALVGGNVLARVLVEKYFGKEAKIEKTILGKDLVGLEYEPLFDVPKMRGDKSYKVYAADFVNTDEGTGIVHTAVIYGEDDYQLGLREDLPQVPLLNPNGTYNEEAPEFLRGQYIKKAERAVIEDLEKRGLLFAKAANTHSYPHCWRCGTALIYNALSSWFINIQNIKQELISKNENLNWVPEHLKHGRFLNIVENAPDWGISRNRYWASPLPVWKHGPDTLGLGGCNKVEVIGSLEELSNRITKSGNKYFLMRHGKAESNNTGRIADDPHEKNDLTDAGREAVLLSAQGLKSKSIDLIISSHFDRTKQTAELVAQELGLDPTTIVFDERLREMQVDESRFSNWEQIHAALGDKRFGTSLGSGETVDDVRKRACAAMFDLEDKYKGKNILIVTHGIVPVTLFASLAKGSWAEMNKAWEGSFDPKTAEWTEFPFWPYPHRADYMLDLHRPYIDEPELVCDCGKELRRIPEVIDCWVESGSMPFAEYHYPFENVSDFEKRSPGDFVSEYIAQTRTWFYYMHVMATALFGHESFKNVVTTGNILAADGSKMSKSKKNYTDPLLVMDRYGADAYRFALMGSVVMQAEDVAFRDEDVKEVQQRVLNMFENVVVFYELYRDKSVETPGEQNLPKNILDRWIIYRSTELLISVTENFDTFQTVQPAREIREFVGDLSAWYLRRSRERIKDGDVDAKITLYFILRRLAKLMAPVTPFISENVFQRLRMDGDPESIHLTDWSHMVPVSDDAKRIIDTMEKVRQVVSLGLEARQQAGIKVRQPLSRLVITQELDQEYLELIRDEVNVKEVVVGKEFSLDTTITPELKLEGDMRDLIRQIQDKRKELGLQTGDKISLTLPSSLGDLVAKYEEDIKKSVHASEINFGETLIVEKA
jgi:isoleucyl-tRNA synthetase